MIRETPPLELLKEKRNRPLDIGIMSTIIRDPDIMIIVISKSISWQNHILQVDRPPYIHVFARAHESWAIFIYENMKHEVLANHLWMSWGLVLVILGNLYIEFCSQIANQFWRDDPFQQGSQITMIFWVGFSMEY